MPQVLLKIIGFSFIRTVMKTWPKIIALSISFALLISTATVLAKRLIGSDEINTELLYSIVSRIIILLILVLLFKLPAPKTISIKNTKYINKIVPFVAPVFICILVMLVNISTFMSVSFERILLFIIAMTSVAFLEEFIFRGIVFNHLLNDKYSVYRAAIFSAILFGGIHIINAFLFEHRPFGHTLSQMIFAAAIGMFFCGLYYRTGNLWGIILVHTLVNISFGTNRLTQSVLYPVVTGDGNGSSLASLVFTLLVYGFIAASGAYMIYLEKKRRQKASTDLCTPSTSCH